MTPLMRSILGFGIAGAMACAAIADVRVTLRASASVDAKRSVTVADVAEIDPPTTEEATRLAEVVVLPAGETRAGLVTIAQVREAMDAAKVNWGRTSLRGAACSLTAGSGEASGTGKPANPAKNSPKLGIGQTTPQMVDVGGDDGASTVRHAVCGRLLDLYNVDAASLRLAFDAADEDFLARPIGESRVDVQPNGTGGSVRTPVSIVIYEGDRIAATRTIAVQALINRAVVTARGPIARGQTIGQDDVEVGRQWMGPNAKPPVGPEAAIGQVAARGVQAGAILTSVDVTAPLVCKRGDIVWVHALAGPLTVKAKCRAQGQARDGELVQLKMDGGDRTFSARMSGPGRAVMVTDK